MYVCRVQAGAGSPLSPQLCNPASLLLKAASESEVVPFMRYRVRAGAGWGAAAGRCGRSGR